MNPGNTHGTTLNDKPRHLAHRRLDEDVLHSAQEDMFGEPASEAQHGMTALQEWLGPVKRKITGFTTRKPLTAALFAMAMGGLLILALERSLLRGNKGKRRE